VSCWHVNKPLLGSLAPCDYCKVAAQVLRIESLDISSKWVSFGVTVTSSKENKKSGSTNPHPGMSRPMVVHKVFWRMSYTLHYLIIKESGSVFWGLSCPYSSNLIINLNMTASHMITHPYAWWESCSFVPFEAVWWQRFIPNKETMRLRCSWEPQPQPLPWNKYRETRKSSLVDPQNVSISAVMNVASRSASRLRLIPALVYTARSARYCIVVVYCISPPPSPFPMEKTSPGTKWCLGKGR